MIGQSTMKTLLPLHILQARNRCHTAPLDTLDGKTDAVLFLPPQANLEFSIAQGSNAEQVEQRTIARVWLPCHFRSIGVDAEKAKRATGARGGCQQAQTWVQNAVPVHSGSDMRSAT